MLDDGFDGDDDHIKVSLDDGSVDKGRNCVLLDDGRNGLPNYKLMVVIWIVHWFYFDDQDHSVTKY